MPLQQNVSSTVASYLHSFPFPPLLIEIDFAFQMRLVSHSVILFDYPLVSVIVIVSETTPRIADSVADSDSVFGFRISSWRKSNH